ncbi:X-Pro dipeptidyl-peptidase protein [Rhizodiscina lignyota]|uniref:X-Pro dipeptidyl-peptidase protein n=1 Tax=Rhizodiscina lignyota TaxID=1504668 RepID=A0A9P4MEV1_9PEZI|nr:X-Pro dipeptidyl-peptidase protein [Rhizodiscina lignyota]
MPNKIKDIQETFYDEENNVLFDKNVSIPIPNSDYPIRCNIYRPLSSSTAVGTALPVIMTYGPYGKDIEYNKFHPQSFSEVEPEQKSKYSAWETPDPVFWTRHGYAVVRCDERGFGQSPGYLDSMSNDTANAFCHAIEWAAQRPWSNGKVGLLGVSYFAGTQWRVAARQPRGLACIIPWEGMSDYYRDRCRHGGILSDAFIRFWWNRQVITNQYGRPGRAAAGRGDDTIEGDLSEEELKDNRRDQNIDNEKYRFRDQEYYASRDFRLEDIKVPLLSVANLGNSGLHLRGNVVGYMFASSEFKFLRFMAGRHDLPFYYKDEVELQRGFLDAWLKGKDEVGWSVPGKIASVSVLLRKGDVGHNNAEAEKLFQRREEREWPIARTEYVRFYLTQDSRLTTDRPARESPKSAVTYKALGSVTKPEFVTFLASFKTETEITGHIAAHLNVSVSPCDEQPDQVPSDMDIFVTLRHLDAKGKEILYTGAVGDPVPVTKGWLRCSLRKTDEIHSQHRSYLPYRQYFSTDEELLEPGIIYAVDVEIWPTNVIMSEGDTLVLEVASGDTGGSGLFRHENTTDRSTERFGGLNTIHFGEGVENYLQLPIIPKSL